MVKKVPYREKTAVASVNEVKGRAGEPRAGGNVMDLEIDILWRSPSGDRDCIGI